ncbi:MAG: MerR family transcriptional regulator [Tannerella sp.]|jgi:DNA-binding transcriptional MerR regulator|nr:MerR family transcriptional regulator [Tannerella sp.]
MVRQKKEAKLYCSIKEVAQRFGVNESTLRFWEKEFDEITPRRNGKGTRFYLDEDVRIIQWIYQLLKVEGMTLEGAKKVLAKKKDRSVADQAELLNRLNRIRTELVSLVSAVDAYKHESGEHE